MSGSRAQPVSTIILCIISIVLLLLSRLNRHQAITTVINTTSIRILYPFTTAKHFINYHLSVVTSIPHQYRQLLDLERQLTVLETQNQKLNTLERENTQLRSQLKLANTPPPESISAIITSFNRYALVNAGARQGVSINQAVVRDQVLIGLITDVYPNAAKVRLVNDPEFSIEAITTKQTSGLLTHKDDQIVFTNVLQKDTLLIEDSVFTKGTPTVPPNLLIGKIKSIISATSDIYQTATLELPSQFLNHDSVIIIKH